MQIAKPSQAGSQTKEGEPHCSSFFAHLLFFFFFRISEVCVVIHTGLKSTLNLVSRTAGVVGSGALCLGGTAGKRGSSQGDTPTGGTPTAPNQHATSVDSNSCVIVLHWVMILIDTHTVNGPQVDGVWIHPLHSSSP